MREIVSGLMTRLVCFTVPALLLADLTRALGGRIRLAFVILAAAVPTVGLIVDSVRVRAKRAIQSNAADSRFESVRPFQYRLRTLLLVMIIASVYFSFRFGPAVRQRRIIVELRAAGVPIAYDHRAAGWLEGVFGPEMFGTVDTVTLRTNAEIAKIAVLPRVRKIHLWGPGITNVVIETLMVWPPLQELTLNDTNMTAEGVQQLKESLPNCRVVVYPHTVPSD
jgi:hypothetical protein